MWTSKLRVVADNGDVVVGEMPDQARSVACARGRKGGERSNLVPVDETGGTSRRPCGCRGGDDDVVGFEIPTVEDDGGRLASRSSSLGTPGSAG